MVPCSHSWPLGTSWMETLGHRRPVEIDARSVGFGDGCGMNETTADLDNGLAIEELNEKMGYRVVRYVMQKRTP
jgi:hypothetical protein